MFYNKFRMFSMDGDCGSGCGSDDDTKKPNPLFDGTDEEDDEADQM